jgi:hypothetical protein
MDGDVYVVPVIEEEVVIQHRLRLKEELRVRRVLGRHDEPIRTPVRRERVIVEQHWYDDGGPPPDAEPPPPNAADTRVYQREPDAR